MRINKHIADLGIASRREADRLIEEGKVLVNGKPAVIGQQIDPKKDKVEVKGANELKKIYLAYYKGRGIITHSAKTGEVDVAMRLKKDYGLTDVYPLGRLDKNSEGLILLTNDGRLTEPLLDPKAGHEKEYEVTVDKKILGRFLMQMENGVDIEGYKTKKSKATKVDNFKFNLILTEGKKHQIRRMCTALGYQVLNLKRVRITSIELGKLKPNQYRKLTEEEQKALLKTLQIS
jgi:23S rRNA pseudouridine2604 synthase